MRKEGEGSRVTDILLYWFPHVEPVDFLGVFCVEFCFKIKKCRNRMRKEGGYFVVLVPTCAYFCARFLVAVKYGFFFEKMGKLGISVTDVIRYRIESIS